MRGDAPYLGLLAPGRLDVYSIALDRKSLRQAHVSREEDGSWLATITRLGNTRPLAATSHSNWISNVVLRLLTGSTTRLAEMDGVSGADAISLVGRALLRASWRIEAFAGRDVRHRSGQVYDNRDAAETTSNGLM